MKEQEQRIAIAEFCGWKWFRRPATGIWANKPYRCLYHPGLNPEYTATLKSADMTERQCNEEFIWREGMIPDYPHDLNAMHEAETHLNRRELVNYCNFALRYTTGEGNVTDYKIITATASQRAEALLRTIGKWKD